LAAITLSACATPIKASRPSLEALQDTSFADQAVVIINATTDIKCDYLGLSFLNTEKGALPGESFRKHKKRLPDAFFSMRTPFESKMETSTPAIAVVASGTYKLNSGACKEVSNRADYQIWATLF